MNLLTKCKLIVEGKKALDGTFKESGRRGWQGWQGCSSRLPSENPFLPSSVTKINPIFSFFLSPEIQCNDNDRLINSVVKNEIKEVERGSDKHLFQDNIPFWLT